MSNFKAEYKYEFPVYNVNNHTFRIYFHDAELDKITSNNNKLIMSFSKGFTVQELKDGKWLKPCKTDASTVIFDNFSTANITISESKELDDEWVTVAKDIDFSTFVENINNNKWKLVFIADYLGYYPFFKCEIQTSDKKQFGCEIEIYQGMLESRKITFLWDDMNEW